MTRYRAVQIGMVVLLALAPVLLPLRLVTPLTYVGISALVCIGLVLLTGIAGLTSFGQAAFAGLGAYTTAILTTEAGWPAIAALPVSLAVTGLVALALGGLTVRLAGHYLVLGTLAWGLCLFYLFGNTAGLGGFNGITGLPPVGIGGFALSDPRQIFLLIWGLVVLALLGATNLLDSRTGRAMRSLPSAAMAESMGVRGDRLRVAVFVIAALLAGTAGWLQAHYVRVVNPGPYGAGASIDYLFMAVIGGTGHLGGAIVGPLVYESLRTWLRETLPTLVGRSGSFEIAAFGILVVALLQVASGGIMPFIARLLPARPPTRAPEAAAPLPRAEKPRAGETLLSATGLTKRFGGLVAVDGVSFEVKAGEILGLIGPNGAGKSTIFDILTGISRPSAGTVMLGERRLDGLSARDIAACGIARTFQHVALRPAMTVLENVALGAHLRGRSGILASSLRLDRAEEARLLFEAQSRLEEVGLVDLAQVPAGDLALGQQRLVEVARALAADPKILLLDEPAAGLRFAEKRHLAGLLSELRRQGVTILLVEHDMGFVMNLVDRLVVVDFGQKIAEGRPAVIRGDPAVIEAYLGGIDDELAA